MRGRDDRDVPAGDRDHVADAGGRERGGEVAVDAVAKPDQDARRQARLGLWKDKGESLCGATSHLFQPAPGAIGRGFQFEGSRRERPDRSDALEVLAVR